MQNFTVAVVEYEYEGSLSISTSGGYDFNGKDWELLGTKTHAYDFYKKARFIAVHSTGRYGIRMREAYIWGLGQW